jgi:hypothetical protein
MVDYRGYGHSEGEPNEEGLMKDADVRAQRNADFGSCFPITRPLSIYLSIYLSVLYFCVSRIWVRGF